MKRESWGLFLPAAGMAVIVLMAWFLVFKSPPSPPKPLSLAPPNQQARSDSKQKYKRKDEGPEVGWRTLYRDNWKFLCPVLGRHVVEEDCRLVATPVRLGPIVVRDASVRYGKPFTVKRDPSVPLVKYSIKHPVMSLPEYVGPRFYAERMMCVQYPRKWIPIHRPVIDPQGKLIRYDPEQVRIFCGGDK
ncbi:MAG: hypothetical protein ACYCYP_03105 [Leptospirales bacterium]